MVKIELHGGQSVVVDMDDESSLPQRLRDIEDVIDARHDGKRILIPVRSVAAVVFLG